MRIWKQWMANSLKEAAVLRNLVQNDEEWRRYIKEASFISMPFQLKQLLALIYIFKALVNHSQL